MFSFGYCANSWKQTHHLYIHEPDFRVKLKQSLKGLYFSLVSPIRESFVIKDKAKTNLIISMKNLITLEDARKKIVADQAIMVSNVVPKSFRSYVGAKLERDGEIIPIKVRLKGKGLDHYEADKWSMQIKVDDGYSFMGMKQFTLSNPDRRAVFLYWFLNEALAREDVMHPRLPLLEISINGVNKGLYSVEEVPLTQLMSNNKRKEGVIFTFSDFDFSENTIGGSGKAVNNAFHSADFDLETPKDFLSDKAQLALVERAVNVMRLFQEGKLKTSQVFKVEKLAKWLALCDIMNAWHGLSWANIKLYYDPMTSKFEPINWDAYNLNSAIRGAEARSFRLDDVYNNDPGTYIFKQLFSDLDFMKVYMQELNRITQKDYLDQFIKENRKQIDEYISMARVDFPYHDFDDELSFVYENQKRIRDKYLNVKDALALVSSEMEPHLVKLNLKNSKLVPLEIESLTVNGKLKFFPKKDDAILAGNPRDNDLFSQTVSFNITDKTELKALRGEKPNMLLRYKLLGSDQIVEQNLSYWYQKASKKL